MKDIKNLSDEEILNLYLENREDFYFGTLHSRYIHKVYSKAISLLKDEALAEDAVQEIFLKIFLNISKFTFRSKFSTWVYSITYNYCIDLLRKNKKHKNIFNDNESQIPDQEDDIVDDKKLLELEFQKLSVVLEKIPLEDKTVLVMKYKDNLGIKDISKIIKKSESAVKMKIKRAKGKAQKIYNQLFAEQI